MHTYKLPLLVCSLTFGLLMAMPCGASVVIYGNFRQAAGTASSISGTQVINSETWNTIQIGENPAVVNLAATALTDSLGASTGFTIAADYSVITGGFSVGNNGASGVSTAPYWSWYNTAVGIEPTVANGNSVETLFGVSANYLSGNVFMTYTLDGFGVNDMVTFDLVASRAGTQTSRVVGVIADGVDLGTGEQFTSGTLTGKSTYTFGLYTPNTTANFAPIGNAFRVTVASVPEPSISLLSALGTAAMIFRRSRRRA